MISSSAMNDQLRRIVISGNIREDTAAQFLEQITALECSDITKPISIYIDTYGGSLDSALCMYDAMKSCCCPIVTVGIGKVMSAGVLLLAAGNKGNRFITQNTRVMVHEVSSGVIGPLSEMEVSVAEARKMQELYVELLSYDTGKGIDKIKADLKKTTYISAEEAIKYGIADKLVPTKGSKSCKKSTKKKTTKKKTTKKTTKKKSY